MSEIYLKQGDCLPLLKEMPTGEVTAVISDPPYGLGIADWDKAMPEQVILDECLRISRGPVLWFGASQKIGEFYKYDPEPERVLIWAPAYQPTKAKSKGIVYRYHIIACWSLPEMPGRRIWDVHNDATERSREWNHPASKPVSLMARLVETFGGQIVLDPYMGSGSTGVACAALGRDFIGYEAAPEYFRMAKDRIFKDKQAKLFSEMPWEELP